MKKPLSFFIWFLLPTLSFTQVSVLTQHNDNARTGANLYETQLTTNNVNSIDFGKIFKRKADDQIYAQPLIVTNLNIPGKGNQNVVFVATVNNSVYAYDAEVPSDTAAFWHKNLTPVGAKVVNASDETGACHLYSGNIGIVATPVIDTTAKTIYVFSRDKVTSTGKIEQWLHAMDIITGAEKSGSPVRITATYIGNGAGSVSNTITFDPLKENQRASLLLVNNIVYIAWASYCDWAPYHGWVMGYDATTLQQKYVWMDNANGSNAGIWMSGQGISADASGNIYLTVGNGTVGQGSNAADTINRGESFLKLRPLGNTLHIMSFFTPHEWSYLENNDLDVGSSCLLLIPGTNWAFSGGKEGMEYLVNRDTMGGVDITDHVIQEFSVGTGNELHGGPVFWHSSSKDYVYIWPGYQPLSAYSINYVKGNFDMPAAMHSSVTANYAVQGGFLSVSANGSAAGSGIIWASLPRNKDAELSTVSGILRAYDAADLNNELWNSNMNPARDSVGGFAKFVCPTIANGKVYLATFSGELLVYGLMQNTNTGTLPTKDNDLKLYPNPTNNNLTVTFNITKETTVVIRLTDMRSNEIYREVKNHFKGEYKTNIDLSKEAKGMYMINVTTNEYNLSRKVIVE